MKLKIVEANAQKTMVEATLISCAQATIREMIFDGMLGMM